MQKIERLRQSLTFDEFTKGTEVWRDCRAVGIEHQSAIGCVYRAGRLAEKDKREKEVSRLYKTIKELRVEIETLKGTQPESLLEAKQEEINDNE